MATMRPSRFHGNIPKSSFIRRSGLPLSSLSHSSAFRELGKKAIWSRKFQRRLSEFTVGSADCKKQYSSCFLTTPGMWRFSLRPSRRGSMMLTQRPDLWQESKYVFYIYLESLVRYCMNSTSFMLLNSALTFVTDHFLGFVQEVVHFVL